MNVPLSITVLTAIIGLSVTLYTQSRIRLREIDAAHRERKLEIYLNFLEAFDNLSVAGKPEFGENPVDPNRLARDLLTFRTRAVLWGSPGVLKALSKIARPNQDLTEMFSGIEAIQREMRKDLGLSNRGLEKSFFNKLRLTDPDEYDKIFAGRQ